MTELVLVFGTLLLSLGLSTALGGLALYARSSSNRKH